MKKGKIFDTKILNEQLDGKFLSTMNGAKFESQNYYSKHLFATRMVNPQQDSIDFGKFQEILEEINSVVEQYYQLRSNLIG